MKTNQAINYLETLAASPINPREMSKSMFKLVRAAARVAQRAYPCMAGYYDPEYDGPRANPDTYIYAQAHISAIIPQSQKLQNLLLQHFPVSDPFSNSADLFGL